MAAPVAGEGTEGIDEPSMLLMPEPMLVAPMCTVLLTVLSAAPTKPGREVDEAEEMPLVPLSVPDTHTISAARVTRVVSGDCGLRMMVPSMMAGEVESSWGEPGMVAKTSSVQSSLVLEETTSSWRSKEKSFLTCLPVVVLSTVKRLTKAKVAVDIDVLSALAGLDFGLDWAMKCGRLTRMACRVDSASVCTIEVMVLVKRCCLLARMVRVVVVECSR